MSKEIQIIVATHKKSDMPTDKMYLPLHVGAAGKFNDDGTPLDFGYVKDNTGDNLSLLNPVFSELTGLYWAWKNLDADYKGLVHYRRHFIGSYSDKNDMLDSVITYEEIKPMLDQYKIFTPKKRWYVIETLYSHYAHTLDENHLKVCRHIIEDKSPSYLKAYDKVLKRRWGYMFNMMILQNDLMDDYCSWLFVILFELVENIDQSGMSDFEKRFCGRVSEILFDVWIEYKLETGLIRKDEIKELPYMEDVDWNYKIKAFLAAKFLNKRYGESS